MTHAFATVDIWLFFLVNHGMSNAFCDAVMPVLTDLNKFVAVRILAAGAIILLLLRGKERGRTLAVLLVVTAVLTDQFSSSVVKPLVGRARPCVALEGVRLLVDCGSGFSFPSSHAVNNFGAATLITYFYRRSWPIWYALAASVAFSRVYVGVHYPSDVIGGAALGAVCALAVIAAWKRIERRLRRPAKRPDNP